MEDRITSDIKPYVFLFNADTKNLNGNYSVFYGRALFNSILSLQCSINASIYLGDLLLTELCQRISSVKKIIYAA